MLVTVELSKPFKNMTPEDRETVMNYFWSILPKQVVKADVARFVLEDSVQL